MARDESYAASPVKRERATKAEMAERRARLYEITKAVQPASVRGVYYQASVQGAVEKTDSGYDKVQGALVHLREAGVVPFGWIVDLTRRARKPLTYSSVDEALEDAAQSYRKALWDDADAYVEIWLEKDALAGVILPITRKYDVSLMVARGFSSITFLYSAAEHISQLDVPVHLYHLGDFDPSGVSAGEKIEENLRKYAPNADIHFERLAVLPEQIVEWRLPTRPTKESDSRSKGFGPILGGAGRHRPAGAARSRRASDPAAPAQASVRYPHGRRGVRAGSDRRHRRNGPARGLGLMAANTLLAALMIGRRIGPVFPTVAGKPLCRHGYKDATRDSDGINALWARCPDANVSVPMGRASGLLGLDVDQKGGRDGIAALAAQEAEYGALPDTPHYSTRAAASATCSSIPASPSPTSSISALASNCTATAMR
jgi:hypothetical protein